MLARKGSYALCLPRHSHITRQGRVAPAAESSRSTHTHDDGGRRRRRGRTPKTTPVSSSSPTLNRGRRNTVRSSGDATGASCVPSRAFKAPSMHFTCQLSLKISSASRLTRFLTQPHATAACTNHSQAPKPPVHVSTHPSCTPRTTHARSSQTCEVTKMTRQGHHTSGRCSSPTS